MADRAKLSKGVSGEGEETSVSGDVERKDATIGAILLYRWLAIGEDSSIPSRGATCPPGTVVEGPDGLVHVDRVAKAVGEGRAFGHGRGHGRLEEIHCLQNLRAGGRVSNF